MNSPLPAPPPIPATPAHEDGPLVLTKTKPAAHSPRHLPQPPSDTEKYAYLGRQHRWFLLFQVGAFAIVASDFNSFGDAIRRKLIQEIAGIPLPAPTFG